MTLLGLFHNTRHLAAATALAIVLPAAADAATTISSSATSLTGALTVAGVTATVTPIGQVSGTAGAAFNKSSAPVVTANQTLGLGSVAGGTLSQGVSTGVVTSTVKGDLAANTGSATTTINDLGLSLALDMPILPDVTLASLLSSAIISTTTFDGTSLVGSSSIAGPSLSGSIPALSLGLTGTIKPDPNTTLFNLLGLKIIANEQIGATSIAGGIQTQSLTTNALHIVYDNFALSPTRVLNGNLIVGQSMVSVNSAVPETATWAMMIVGFGAIGGTLRASRRKPADLLARL